MKKKSNAIRLEYAGAKNPIFYVQNNQINQLRGNKFSIGGYQKGRKRIFDTQSLELDKPSTIYLFSDGYYDQLGGGIRKRMGKEQFKEILQKVQSKKLQEQKKLLVENLETWMDGLEQIDDILVMGIHLKPM